MKSYFIVKIKYSRIGVALELIIVENTIQNKKESLYNQSI